MEEATCTQGEVNSWFTLNKVSFTMTTVMIQLRIWADPYSVRYYFYKISHQQAQKISCFRIEPSLCNIVIVTSPSICAFRLYFLELFVFSSKIAECPLW